MSKQSKRQSVYRWLFAAIAVATPFVLWYGFSTLKEWSGKRDASAVLQILAGAVLFALVAVAVRTAFKRGKRDSLWPLVVFGSGAALFAIDYFLGPGVLLWGAMFIWVIYAIELLLKAVGSVRHR